MNKYDGTGKKKEPSLNIPESHLDERSVSQRLDKLEKTMGMLLATIAKVAKMELEKQKEEKGVIIK